MFRSKDILWCIVPAIILSTFSVFASDRLNHDFIGNYVTSAPDSHEIGTIVLTRIQITKEHVAFYEFQYVEDSGNSGIKRTREYRTHVFNNVEVKGSTIIIERERSAKPIQLHLFEKDKLQVEYLPNTVLFHRLNNEQETEIKIEQIRVNYVIQHDEELVKHCKEPTGVARPLWCPDLLTESRMSDITLRNLSPFDLYDVWVVGKHITSQGEERWLSPLYISKWNVLSDIRKAYRFNEVTLANAGGLGSLAIEIYSKQGNAALTMYDISEAQPIEDICTIYKTYVMECQTGFELEFNPVSPELIERYNGGKINPGIVRHLSGDVDFPIGW